MRETLGLVLIGLAIGLPAALMATRLISSRLFGLTPTDPLTITLAALLLIVVSVFAGVSAGPKSIPGRSDGGTSI